MFQVGIRLNIFRLWRLLQLEWLISMLIKNCRKKKRREREQSELCFSTVFSLFGDIVVSLFIDSLFFERIPVESTTALETRRERCCVTTAPERGTDGHSLIHVLALVSNCDCLSLVRMMKKGAKESPTLFFIHSPLRETDAETGKYIFGGKKDSRCRERDNPCHSQRWQQLESSDH